MQSFHAQTLVLEHPVPETLQNNSNSIELADSGNAFVVFFFQIGSVDKKARKPQCGAGEYKEDTERGITYLRPKFPSAKTT